MNHEAEAYLAALEPGARRALSALRAAIQAVEPRMTERLCRGVPFFYLRGRQVVGYGAARGHLSFYVMQGQSLKRISKPDLESLGFEISRTVVRFRPEQDWPEALVREIVTGRLAELC